MTPAQRDRRRVYVDRIIFTHVSRVLRLPLNERQAGARRCLLRNACMNHTLPLKQVLSDAGTILDEENLKRFVVSLGKLIKEKKYQSGKAPLDAVDSVILAFVDGFDILSIRGLTPTPTPRQARNLPSILRWSGPAGASYVNWYCRGQGSVERVDHKTYLMRLRRLGLKLEKPVLVRQAKDLGWKRNEGRLSIHFSPEGVKWWEEQILQKKPKKCRTTRPRSLSLFAADAKEVQARAARSRVKRRALPGARS
jgi:hypothetical protein